MSTSQATQSADTDQVSIRGQLDATQVPNLLRHVKQWLDNASDTLRVELGEIERADSAGIAFLIEIQRQAKAAGKASEFTHATEQLRALADFCELDQVLPLQ